MPDRAPDLLSQRESATLLHGSRAQECRALECGLGGVPTIVGRRHLYERVRIEQLAERPPVDLDELADLVTGVVVIRLPRSVPASTATDPIRLEGWAGGPWRPTLPLTVLLQELAWRRLATVICVSRYVAASMDTLAVDRGAEGLTLRFGPAGSWADVTTDRTWAIGPGGRTFRYLHLQRPHRRWWA